MKRLLDARGSAQAQVFGPAPLSLLLADRFSRKFFPTSSLSSERPFPPMPTRRRGVSRAAFGGLAVDAVLWALDKGSWLAPSSSSLTDPQFSRFLSEKRSLFSTFEGAR